MGVIDKIKGFIDWGMELYNKLLMLSFKVSFVKVDRKQYLTRTLQRICTPEELDIALEGRPSDVLGKDKVRKLANRCILRHSLFTALLSALAVVPVSTIISFVLMIADLVQFQWVVFILAQKITYLYGEKDINGVEGKEEKGAAIMLTVSAIMIGAHRMAQNMKSIVGSAARQIVLKATTRTSIRVFIVNVMKQALKWCGIEAAKESMVLTLSVLVNAISMCISGFVSFWLLYPMGKRLVRHFEEQQATAKNNKE